MSEWIKCSDRLPELETEVLVCQRKANTTDNFFVAYLNSFTVRRNRTDAEWSSNGDYDISYITHWQNLPEPPKE